MPSIAVIGTQWGDEGKAKIVDFLAGGADAVVRTSGGNNAGHTVVINDKRYRFSSVPCGIIHPNVLGIIGNGSAVNPAELLAEMEHLRSEGFYVDNVRISWRAHLVMPYHLILDSLMNEVHEGGDGDPASARYGIRPCYMDKIERIGIRVCDLLQPDVFARKVRRNTQMKNRLITRVYGGVKQADAEQTIAEYMEYAKKLAPYITDTGELLEDMLSNGKKVIFEGAQATMLDPDYGTYPFVTTSYPTIGGMAIGSGVGLNAIEHSLGVIKAYTSRAGRGPFPTEIFNDDAQVLRDRGNEYEPSGQFRRVGWFDAFAADYAARVTGLDGFALTKMDALRDMREVRICTGYKYKGEIMKTVPASAEIMAQCEPVYETIPGWGRINDCSSYEELPDRAKFFIRRIEELTGTPVLILELGLGRNKIICTREVSWLEAMSKKD